MGKLSENITTSTELRNYLKEKGTNHSNYKFYTSLPVINAILDNHALFLSKGDNWNDLQDRANFNPDDDSIVRFGLCMSYAKSENVAMWMLYGRNDGYMVDFGKEIIKSCLACSKLSCGRIKEDRFESLLELDDGQFSIEVMDIVYYGEPKNGDINSFYIKRADEVEQNCPINVINGIKYCKKTLPWQYECECRLIVSISKSIVGIDRCDTVSMDFGGSHIAKMKERIYHTPNHGGTLTYERSKLAGKIQWNI